MKQIERSDEARTLAQRFECVSVLRVRDKKRIAEALRVQDSLRKKTSGRFEGSKEIEKWREHR